MQKLQLSIPEPCHENWQQMTPTDQGRFCNACARDVIDFSMMTDTEVLNYFTTLTHDKVCGRALPSQLERTISKPKDPKKRLFWYWNYIVMFFLFFGKGNSVKAQGITQVVTAADLNKIKQTNINNALAGKVGEVVVSHNRIITGKVTDIDGKPVSYASVKIKGTPTGVSADVNGVYSLKTSANAILIICAGGFRDTEVPVKRNQTVFNTVLEKRIYSSEVIEVTMVLGGMRPVKSIKKTTFIESPNVDTLYVLDGVTTTKAKVDNLNPDDIADVIRLEKNQAATIFGSKGSNGAIVITTRKAKEIKLKEVVVTSGTMMGGIRNVTISETTIIERCEILVDTVKTFVANLTGAIKIYPNPVQRGNEISIALKLRQTGLHQIQISDAAGQIVLQKQINASAKESTEKIIADARWSSGMYYMSITDAKNKLINKSSFIVQ